jgi:hypothetical protein
MIQISSFLKMGKGGKIVIIVIIIILVLALIGLLIWYFLYHKKKKTPDPDPTPGPTPDPKLKWLTKTFSDTPKTTSSNSNATYGFRFTVKKPIIIKEIKSRYKYTEEGAFFTIWKEGGGAPILNRVGPGDSNNSVKTYVLIPEGSYRIGMDFITVKNSEGKKIEKTLYYLSELPESQDKDVVTIDESCFFWGNNTYPKEKTPNSNYFINFLYST